VASSTLIRLADIAQDQWGLVTRRQAELAGVSPRTLGRLVAERSVLERVGQGVYRIAGAPIPDHMDLRAAWLQLAPQILAWKRTAAEGVVSHRSAAALYDLGHLPADRHEFTLPTRRQSRRHDMRLHTRALTSGEWITLRGMPVTRPSRIASDLLWETEDPQAVAQLIADALRNSSDYPGTFADALARHAARFGLRKGDGIALLRWLLDLVLEPQTQTWMDEARAHADRPADAARDDGTTPPNPLARHGAR
jgi:predicted transcriptional regulator of viral defense system